MRASETAMLRVVGICKNFGGVAAVADVSFSVAPRELVALIGPNGAGKTTCFNVVTGFTKPRTGQVFFDGCDVTGRQPHAMARLGVVRTFQKTSILRRLSVFENVLAAHHLQGATALWRTFFPGRNERESERRLRASAAAILELLGLGARMNSEAGSLSSGELRLLEIAIALGAKPRLLMLDEPAAGLNTQQAVQLADTLKRLVGTSVEALLMVEHNMSVVMSIADRIVVMNLGRKLVEGTPEQIRADPRVVEAYLGKAA
jgi:branched-chain amino acid transport system ATP-binding protein